MQNDISSKTICDETVPTIIWSIVLLLSGLCSEPKTPKHQGPTLCGLLWVNKGTTTLSYCTDNFINSSLPFVHVSCQTASVSNTKP